MLRTCAIAQLRNYRRAGHAFIASESRQSVAVYFDVGWSRAIRDSRRGFPQMIILVARSERFRCRCS